jgi:S-adenosylmethionine synthetase
MTTTDIPHGAEILTSESVTEGHPDKVCDQIADSVLDAVLAQDRHARVACEVAAAKGTILVFGEMTTDAWVDIAEIVRATARRIGYTDGAYGLDADGVGVLTAITPQSPDIARGVTRGTPLEQGAGDQGIMFGYAADETPERMPLPISLAHVMARRLAEVRRDGTLPWLRPDGKTQVSVLYGDDGRPERITAVVCSAQHSPDIDMDDLRAAIRSLVIEPSLPAGLLDDRTAIHINPTGRFVTGGPAGDSGLTGRKLVVDTYGGACRMGGGALSGKDASKVDRSAAYAARYAARNIVAAGLARRVEVGLAYAIGVADPVSIRVETFGTGTTISDRELAALTAKAFDFRPGAIIERLHLTDPSVVRYAPVAAYGHFGRPDLDLPWEREDVVEALLRG